MLDLKQVEAVFTIIWPQQDWNGGDEGFCRAVAEKVVRTLQAAGPEPAVAVKPLEWKKPPHSESLSRAETDFGVYRAWTHFEAGGRWFWSLDGYQKASGEVSNEDEAKATCQADHDARISGRVRSALVATPPAERVVEARTHPLEIYADSYAQMARMGDGKVDCRSVEIDIRQNMIPVTTALAANGGRS